MPESRIFRESLAVMRADVLNRTRNRRFLVVLLASMYLGHLVTVGHLETALGNNEYRGVHNTAWLGTNMAIAASVAIAMFGFYYTKSTISFDRQDGPGQLIASSQISTVAYLFGKWLSNLVIILAILVAMAFSVVVLFFLRGTGPFDPGTLFLPLIVFVVPIAALTAAIAVVFETNALLRGSIGNVIYLFGLLIVVIAPIDPLGSSFIIESMQQSLAEQYPEHSTGGFSWGYIAGEYQRFEWEGLEVTTQLLFHRLTYLMIAPVIVLLSVVPFNRLDPDSGISIDLPWVSNRAGTERSDDGSSPNESTSIDPDSDPSHVPDQSLETLDSERRFRPDRVLIAELKLALSGRSRLWYVGFIGLILSGIVVPDGTPVQVILTLSWIWPLFIWSSIGVRELRHNTHELVSTTSYPLVQLLAAWGAGAIITGLLVGPVAIRMILAAELGIALTMLVGVVLIPSLAAASGVLTRTNRTFEIGYLLFWYVGIVNQTSVLDYGGITGAPMTSISVFAAIGIGALSSALFVRQQQIR